MEEIILSIIKKGRLYQALPEGTELISAASSFPGRVGRRAGVELLSSLNFCRKTKIPEVRDFGLAEEVKLIQCSISDVNKKV